MKYLLITLICVSFTWVLNAQSVDQSDRNKEIVKKFYHDLWFTNNTDSYDKYVAEEYVVHDIGDRKGVVEPAIEQKDIADFFWENGELESEFDFQIAEGDLVATRWIARFKPESIFGKIFIGSGKIPIINVFRLADGKIVEVWNHRHDIDTRQTLKYTMQGLLIGLVIALIPTFLAIRYWRKLKKIS